MEDIKNEIKDGNYFLKLIKIESDKINDLASDLEHELENGENLPEEITGKLRAAVGKARLLVKQKFCQFEGLCRQNLSRQAGEAFPVMNEDLEGFWDLVSIQVFQVYDAFDEINKLKNNNWKIICEVQSKPVTPINNLRPKKMSSNLKTTPRKSPAAQIGGKS